MLLISPYQHVTQRPAALRMCRETQYQTLDSRLVLKRLRAMRWPAANEMGSLHDLPSSGEYLGGSTTVPDGSETSRTYSEVSTLLE
jgi:hypothetical protein